VLDNYIRTGEIEDPAVKASIDRKHVANLHKISPMPAYNPGISRID
jgi:NAD+ synthase